MEKSLGGGFKLFSNHEYLYSWLGIIISYNLFSMRSYYSYINSKRRRMISPIKRREKNKSTNKYKYLFRDSRKIIKVFRQSMASQKLYPISVAVSATLTSCLIFVSFPIICAKILPHYIGKLPSCNYDYCFH